MSPPVPSKHLTWCLRNRVQATAAPPHRRPLLSARSAHARLSGPVLFDDGKLRALFREPGGHLICLEAPNNLRQ